jgi:LysR family glycine cleavage system transcriptional activator
MPSPHRILPPLDLLRGFDSAARHLSFTRAAAELFLTQSAVSRQIQALEEFLGVTLFERRHKALALTDAGRAYFRTVGPVLDELREATRRLRETRSGHVLTVTTTISFASMWLVPRLARWRKAHPGIDVRITATHDVLDLEREGIDLAIRDCALDHVPQGAVRLAGEHLMPMCSPEYLREARREKRPLAKPADLRHHVLLTLHDARARWPWLSWSAWLEAMHVEDFVPIGTLAYDQHDQVMHAAVHGQGIALGRVMLASQLLREKKLVTLFGGRQHLARAYHAVYARGAEARPEARALVEWVAAEIEPEAQRLRAAPA